MAARKTLEERLLARREIDPATDCWRWGGTHINEGYGMIWAWGRMRLVHRVSHVLYLGPVDDDEHVDHVAARGCVHTDCFNPAHLEAVTPRTNAERSSNPVASVLTDGTCQRGHEMTPENRTKRGNQCLACNRAASRASHARLADQRRPNRRRRQPATA